jgi:hypothetical protein
VTAFENEECGRAGFGCGFSSFFDTGIVFQWNISDPGINPVDIGWNVGAR